MAEIGQLGAQTYRMGFPEQQPAQQEAPQLGGQPAAFNQQKPKDPLAYRGQLNRDYYTNYGLLESFVKEMAKQGVDVTVPDFSQPGGGELFQQYQILSAASMAAADALASEMKAETDLRQPLAEGKIRMKPGVNQEGLFYSDQNNFFPTTIDPSIAEGNVRARQHTYTKTDQDAINAEILKEHAELDNRVAAGLMSPEEAELQKSYSVKNVRGVYAPSLLDRSGGKENTKSLLSLFEKVTNHSQGVFPTSGVRDVIVRGKNYVASNEFAGDSFGTQQVEKIDSNGNRTLTTVPTRIKRTLKDENGNVYFQYEDPDMELEPISNLSPDEVMRRLVESNSSKYGGANALPTFYNELSKTGLMGDNTSVPPGTVFGQNARTIAQSTKPSVPGMDRIQKLAKDQFNQLSTGDLRTLSVPIPDGATYKFELDVDGKGIYLSNYKDFGYQKTTIPDKFKNLTYDKFLKLLDEVNYWEPFLNNRKAEQQVSNKPDNLTAAQEQKWFEFLINNKRYPTESELKQIISAQLPQQQSNPIASKPRPY